MTTGETPETEQHSERIATPEEARRLFITPKHASYDVIVIGGGSAGISAATLAASLGAHVALLDREKLGGECLYTGCVASKALLQVARTVALIHSAATQGLSAALAPVDLAAVSEYVQRAIREVYTESDAPEHFIAQGIDVILGDVRLIAGNAVSVNGQTITARYVLICTGSHPMIPPIPGLREAGYLTNETIFALRTLPARLAVIGGGPIGCELGQAFARFGAQVTILDLCEHLLPRDEPEASAVLEEHLRAEGVQVMTRATIEQVALRGAEKVLTVLTPERGASELVVDELLVAVGRAPNVAELGLDAAGVKYDLHKGITVDNTLRTSSPHVYAAGDVTGGYLFTHAAALQARTAIRNMLFRGQTKLNERVMPWTTFTEPEVAHVGLAEVEARQRRGAKIEVYRLPMRQVDRAVAAGETVGFVKLICTRNGQLLGATVVGPSAGEFINELALAMRHYIPLDKIATTTHVYPTVALSLQQAAGQFSAAKTKRSRLVKLARTF